MGKRNATSNIRCITLKLPASNTLQTGPNNLALSEQIIIKRIDAVLYILTEHISFTRHTLHFVCLQQQG
jgi:hypothetical protein